MKVLYVSACSVCLELENEGAYYAPAAYRVRLNGTPVLEGQENVFSLFDLTPDTDYTVLVESAGRRKELAFRTSAEACALSVLDFGAVGDGVNDDTAAVQTAIDLLPPKGRLIFPAGIYLCRPLTLRSHLTLELKEGATLLGDPDRSHYPVIPGGVRDQESGEELNFGGFEGNQTEMYASLITGAYLENIAIIGRGTLDGNAQNSDFWTNFKNFPTARPRLVFLNRCENITLQGVTCQNSPSWHLHPYYSKDVKFLDIRVKAPANSPNTDALDPESCDYVQIIGCRFSVGDDCIAIKSGKIEMGQKYRQPADHHTIRNCLMEFGHGAVTLGSEMAAGIQNLYVDHCLFRQTDRGLRIKTRRGRGKLCRINNVVFENILMDGVLTPFVINMWYNCCDPDCYSEYNTIRDPLPVDHRTPHLGSFSFRDIRCLGAQVAACYIDGLPESPIDSVELKNVTVSFAEDAKPGMAAMLNNNRETCRMGFYFDNVSKVTIEQVEMENVSGEPVITSHCSLVDVRSLTLK